MTAAVRDLARSFPGRFDIAVESGSADVWLHNPYVRRRAFPGRVIDCRKAVIDRMGTTGRHYVHAYLDLFNTELGTNAQISQVKGDIHLSTEEQNWYSDLWNLCGKEIPFWLICSGGKFDIPIKWWDHQRYQAVVHALRGKVQFVQVGYWGNHHPTLEGAIDLRGKTSVRDLIHLVHHADGVLCGVTSLMHLAAAVPLRHESRTAIVIGGNREPRSWEAYPDHIYLSAGEDLHCGPCWNSKLAVSAHASVKKGVCNHVQNGLPQCMDAISSEQVIASFFELERNGKIQFAGRQQRSLARKGVRSTHLSSAFDQHNLTVQNAPAKAEEFLQSLPPCPLGQFDGRGIVICAGGLGYFSRAWVCIQMLRRFGCTLPIEVWFLGREEMDSRMEQLLAPLGVECIDARKRMEQVPMRNPLGYELKCYSVLHSKFREVLSLDADNVPIVDPTFLFETPEYRSTGAVFWPDYGRLDRHRPIWRLCGVPYRDEPEFESGQMVVNKEVCWRALNLAWWYNDHSELFYQYIHGDKDTFHLAWRRTGTAYSMPPFPIESLEGVMCQHDFQGRRIFQHRNSHKWTFFGDNKPIQGFKLEDVCLQHLEQLRSLWDGKIHGAREVWSHRGFEVRADTSDRGVFDCVAVANEYRLPDCFSAPDRIIDIGAHIGSFVRACFERGSRQIHAFEPHPDNFALARRNVGSLPGVRLHHSAVLHAAGTVSCGPTLRELGHENAGGVVVAPDPAGPVACAAIDDLLRELEHVTLLKLDCEGSEWPILLHLAEWRRVSALCGEYHLAHHSEMTPVKLTELLRKHFRFVRVLPDNEHLGKFWASDIKTFFSHARSPLQFARNRPGGVGGRL